ncbi:MAG: HAD family hydrolase [Dehalococcoidia bacterium]
MFADPDAPGITFDLWRTLIFEFGKKENSARRRELRAEYAVDYLKRIGESVEKPVFYDTFNALSDDITAGHDDGVDKHFGEWIHLGLSRIDPELPERIGLIGLVKVGNAIDKAFIDSPPTLIEGSLKILEAIRRRGLGVGLVTNTGLTSGTAFRYWFEQIGLAGIFHHIAYSNELGIAKPDRLIFDVTLRTLGAPPERALHVGDNLHTDVAGAAAIGMSTVWVKGDAWPEPKMTAKPDFTIETVLELPPVIDQWLESLGS